MQKSKFIKYFCFAVANIVAVNLISIKIFAATATSSSATPAITNIKQVEDLKERLATKVAQLRQTQRKAIAGTVKSVTTTTATLETNIKDIKLELNDNLIVIQYLKGKRTKLTIDDLSKGDNVVVFGEYDPTLDLIQAKVIFIAAASVNQRVRGIVTNIDRNLYTLTLQSADKTDYTIDIEGTTKTSLWTKDDGLVKSGFSKITTGDILEVLGAQTTKEKNRLSAVRILNLHDLTGNPVASATATPAPTKKIYPTAKP